MKKVMKKFNRALSIMLVAAMVLTMAPQTAMPVLAAQTEGVEEQGNDETLPASTESNDDAAGSEEKTEVKPEGKTDGDSSTKKEDPAEDVEESDTTDISGISDATNTEQKNEEEDAVKSEENKITDDTESANTSKKKAPAAVAEDNTESDEPAEEEDSSGAQFAAAEGTGSWPIYIEYADQDNPENPPSDIAEVTFYGAGVDGNNALGGTAVRFHVEAAAGWKLCGNPEVTIDNPTDADPEHKYTTILIPSGDGDYSFSPNKLTDKTFTGAITIKITGEKVVDGLKMNDGTTMYWYGRQGEENSNYTALSTDATGTADDFSVYFAQGQEITIAIPEDATGFGKYSKLKAAVAGTDATTNTAYVGKAISRNEGTVSLNISGTDKSCVTFTFKPSDLTGYEEEMVNKDGVIELSIDADANNRARTLTVTTMGSETNGFWRTQSASGTQSTAATYLNNETRRNGRKYVLADSGVAGLDQDNYDKVEEGDTKLDRVLLVDVIVTDGKQVTVDKVWAEVAKTGHLDEKVMEDIAAEVVEYGDSSPKSTIYAIDFTKIPAEAFENGDLTLTVKASTTYKPAMNEEGFEVHDIEFMGDLDTVEIKKWATGMTNPTTFEASKDTLDKTLTNQEPTFNFAVRPKDGYALTTGTDYNGTEEEKTAGKAIVKVSYDKAYSFKYNSGAKVYYIMTGADSEEHEAILERSGQNNIYKLKSELQTLVANVPRTEITDNTGLLSNAKTQVEADLAEGTSFDETQIGNVNRSLKNIKIEIYTELAKDLDGEVTVSMSDADKKEMTYELTGADVEKLSDGTYRVGGETDILTLTVNSDVKPAVEYEGKTGEFTPVTEVSGENGVYTAQIPVGVLYTERDENGVDKIAATIWISKGNRNITIQEAYNGNAATSFAGKAELSVEDEDEPRKYDAADVTTAGALNGITDGKNVKVTLTAKAGETFTEVSYKVGEKGEEQKVDVSEGATTASFDVRMTDNVTVTVKTAGTFRYKVFWNTSNEATKDGDVYAVPANANTVTVEAYRGSADSEKQNISVAQVFDGDVAAASTASIDQSNKWKVTVTLDKKDTGNVLRLRLQGKRNNTGSMIELPSIQIRKDAVAAGMSITDEDGNVVDAIEIVPGDSRTFNVNVSDGSLNFMDNRIGMEITRNTAQAGTWTARKEGNNWVVDGAASNIKAIYDVEKKQLTIEGSKAAKSGNTDPVFVRFYDMAKRQSKSDKDNELGIIAGSELSVKLNDPVIKGATVTAETFNTVYNLQLALSSSFAGNVVTLSDGSERALYYRIRFTKGAPVTNTKNAKTVEGNYKGIDKGNEDPNVYDEGNKTFYIEKNGASQEILLPVNYAVDNKGNLKGEVQKYDLAVDLVYNVNEGGAIKNTNDLIASQSVELKDVSTAKKNYQFDFNLDKKSVSVYTGQNKQAIAKATGTTDGVGLFDAKIVDKKSHVVKGVSGVAVSTGIDGTIYIDTSGVATAVKNLPKNLAIKVYAFADNAQEVSKYIDLKLVDGLGEIRFENGNNRVLYVPQGKAVTMKVKAVLNETSGVKAKNSKTIRYALGDANGKVSGEAGYKLSQNLAGSVAVNAKNGTIKVNKNYVHDAKNATFTVVASAAGVNSSKVKVTISQDKQSENMGAMVVVDEDGKVIARDGGTLKYEDFLSKKLYVRVLKGSVKQNLNVYGSIDVPFAANADIADSKDYLDGVKFTSGSKKNLAVSSTTGELTLKGSSSKGVKITAQAADGSGSKKQPMTLYLSSPNALTAEIHRDGIPGYTTLKGSVYTYDGAMNEKFFICPSIIMSGGDTQDIGGIYGLNGKKDYYNNIKISVKGAKKTEFRNGGYFEIVKTAPTATITISDKTDKTKKLEFQIVQEPAMNTKGKNLKVTAPKLTQSQVDSARAAGSAKVGEGTIPLKFVIKNGTNFAGQKVLLTADYTRKSLVNKIPYTEEYLRAQNYFLNSEAQKIVDIDKDGSFTTNLINLNGTTNQNVVPGSYRLYVTIGTYANGKFTPDSSVKSAKVTVKIPGKKPKSISMNKSASYVLSLGGEPVNIKDGIGGFRRIAVDGNAVNGGVNGNYARNIVYEDGSTNAFAKYFKISGDGTLSIQDRLKAADFDALLADAAGEKKNLSGYVTLTGYFGTNSNAVESAEVRIDVDLNQAAALEAVMADGASAAYRGANAKLNIVKSGSTEALTLENVKTGSGISFNKAADPKSIQVTVPKDQTDSYEVALKVVTANSALKNADGVALSGANLDKYAATVTAKIATQDPAAAGDDTLEILTAEDALAFNALHTQGEYTTDQAGDKKFNTYYNNGAYTLRVDVKSSIAGVTVNSASIDSSFANTEIGRCIRISKAANNEILFTLNRTQFLSAVEKELVERGGTIEVPVIVGFSLPAKSKENHTLTLVLPTPPTFEETKASIEAAQSAIEAIQADEYLPSGKSSTEDMMDKISAAFREAIALDTQAYVSENPVNVDALVAKDGVYTKKVTVKKTQSNADGQYEHEFTWKTIKDTSWTAADMAGKIGTLLGTDAMVLENKINALKANKDNGIIVDNDYNVDRFMADLESLMEDANIALGSNLSIKVVTSYKKKATEAADGAGEFGIKLSVYDSKTRESANVKGGNYIKVRISPVVGFGSEGEKVKAALNNAQWNEVFYSALKNVNTDVASEMEGRLIDEITKIAKNALTDKNIEVGFEDVPTASGDVNHGEGDVSRKVSVAFTFPADGTEGHVKFTLTLTKGSLKPYKIPVTAADNVPTTALSDGKTFQTLDAAKTAVTDGKTGVFTWDGASKATFDDRLAVTQNSTTDVEKFLNDRLKSVVTGVGFKIDTADITFDDPERKANIIGKARVHDTKQRTELTSPVALSTKYMYEFAFVIPTMASAEAGAKDSVLTGTPSAMSDTSYKAIKDGAVGTPFKEQLPAKDRIAGVTFTDPEKIDAGKYRIGMNGTMKHVVSWTGFSSDSAKQSGYYAALSIPIPEKIQTAVKAPDNVNDSKVYMVIVGTTATPLTGSILKAEMAQHGGNYKYVDHIQRVADNDGTKHDFKLYVDYDGGLSVASTTVTDTTESANNSPNTDMVTYSFDASGVKLDKASEITVKGVSSYADINSGAKSFLTGVGITEANYDKVDLTVSGIDQNTGVVKVTGALDYVELPGFNPNILTEQRGYFGVLQMDVPEGVTITTNAPQFTVENSMSDARDKKALFSEGANTPKTSETLILRLNDEMKTRKDDVKIKVNLGGTLGTETVWADKTYTLDLSGVTFRDRTDNAGVPDSTNVLGYVPQVNGTFIADLKEQYKDGSDAISTMIKNMPTAEQFGTVTVGQPVKMSKGEYNIKFSGELKKVRWNGFDSTSASTDKYFTVVSIPYPAELVKAARECEDDNTVLVQLLCGKDRKVITAKTIKDDPTEYIMFYEVAGTDNGRLPIGTISKCRGVRVLVNLGGLTDATVDADATNVSAAQGTVTYTYDMSSITFEE